MLARQGDKAGSIRALNTLGIIYGESGELLLSLRALLGADALCKEAGDADGQADALNNIGNVYGYLGDYANALDHHQQSLVVCREHGYLTAEAEALHNIGVAYYELGQYGEALAFLEQVLAFDFTDDYIRALALRNTGRSHHKLGRTELARDYLERSLALSQRSADPLNVSYALDDLARLEHEAGRTQGALTLLQGSLTLKQGADDARGESETLLLWAEVCRARGDSEAALTALEKVLVITERVGNSLERYGAYRQLSEVYEERGALRDALTYYQLYDRERERVTSEAATQQLQGLRLRFEVSQSAREREIYRVSNLELAKANDELQALNEALGQADREKSALLAKLASQAREDALTGIYNRRYFDELFAEAFLQARRLGTKLSVDVADSDDFKGINDRFSHATGDAVLRVVGDVLRRGVRDIDTVARYGGEEFTFLLPAADARAAKAVCERLRAAVESYPWQKLVDDLKVTLSLGVSDDLNVENYERMMALADKNQYLAKRGGRNRVV